jgi:DNA-binding transcriptional LysR family regulator
MSVDAIASSPESRLRWIVGLYGYEVQYISQALDRGFSTTIELRHLRYFVAVAEELNFTRAAARVGIGQPPLSQQIRALESELGGDLFRRLPHGVELTMAGAALLDDARALLEQSEALKRTVRRATEGASGRVRIGFTASASFHPIVANSIRDFRSRWPHVDVALAEANTSELLDRLSRSDIDAAFIRTGARNPTGFAVNRLLEESTLLVLPANHPRAGAASLRLIDIANEHILLAPRRDGVELFDHCVAVCRRAGFEPSIVYEAPQITSIPNFVAAGLGVSMVAASVAQIAVNGVVYIPITGIAPVVRLALATRQTGLSPAIVNYAAIVESQRSGYNRD